MQRTDHRVVIDRGGRRTYNSPGCTYFCAQCEGEWVWCKAVPGLNCVREPAVVEVGEGGERESLTIHFTEDEPSEGEENDAEN